MKTLIVTLLTIASVNSFASQLPINDLQPSVLIKEINSRGNLMPGPNRQPTILSEVVFVVKTCRNVTEDDFKLTTSTDQNSTVGALTKLAIQYNGIFVDCFGPMRETEIRLETTAIPAFSSIQLLNPLLRTNRYVH